MFEYCRSYVEKCCLKEIIAIGEIYIKIVKKIDMKIKKLKLEEPKTVKLYNYRRANADKMFETSSGTDITTTCTTIVSSTHINKI